jgi:hypothetical protein
MFLIALQSKHLAGSYLVWFMQTCRSLPHHQRILLFAGLPAHVALTVNGYVPAWLVGVAYQEHFYSRISLYTVNRYFVSILVGSDGCLSPSL